VIGPPGTGKRFLIEIGKILNPVFDEVGSKLTLAGLVGDVQTGTGNVSVSNPGYLAMCSGGVLCFQDFQAISNNIETLLWHPFSSVMDEGIVQDSTKARTQHEALTSLHIDMNRRSQVTRGVKVDAYKDINIDLHIISRFDFIMDIKRNRERQWEIVDAMTEGWDNVNPNTPDSSGCGWERELQCLVASVRSQVESIRVSGELQEYTREKLVGLRSDYELNYPDSELLETMSTRIGASVIKYVMAITAAKGRVEAERSDVDLAFSYIDEKLKFLKTLEENQPVVVVAGAVNPGPAVSSKLAVQMQGIVRWFAGRTGSTHEINTEVNSHLDKKASEKTTGRALGELSKQGLAEYASRMWTVKTSQSAVPIPEQTG